MENKKLNVENLISFILDRTNTMIENRKKVVFQNFESNCDMLKVYDKFSQSASTLKTLFNEICEEFLISEEQLEKWRRNSSNEESIN